MKNLLDLSALTDSRKRGGSAMLGLTLDGGRLNAVVVRRTNGSLRIDQSVSKPLSLDPLTDAPELAGREIRTLLDAGGIHEKRLVVGLPLKWALIAQTQVPPQLGEADLPAFLQIEAERNFPCDVATLVLATSMFSTAAGEKYATFVGMPRNHVERLEQVLRCAQLRPVSFSLGLSALQPLSSEEGTVAFTLGETGLGLQVVARGGLAALRVLDEGSIDTASSPGHSFRRGRTRDSDHVGAVARDLARSIRHVRIFGPRDQAQRLADELELRLEALNLTYDIVSSYAPGELRLVLAPGSGYRRH
jgi:hypothetical protein